MAEPFKVSAVPPKNILLNPLAWILWILDFLVWLISLVLPIKWLMSFVVQPSSVRVGEAWRLAECKKELYTTLYPECKTVHDLTQRSFAVFKDCNACGTRTYLGEHTVEGSRFPLKKYGETKWLTYRELGRKVGHFGAGLLKLGLKPAPDGVDLQKVSGPHTILIFEETCASWVIACFGAFSQSIAVATSYATLGMSAVAEAINETEAKAVVCNIKDVKKLADYCKGKCPSLSVIIYTTNNSTDLEVSQTVDSSLKVLSMDEVIDQGAAMGEPKFSPPTPDHLAVIMYTSGSTGKPKGVMIKHSSMVASVASIGNKFRQLGLKEGQETYIAYLPAAHILELVAEISMLCLGAAVGFACPKTISSKGACRVKPDGTLNMKAGYPYPPGAIQEFRPTCMVAVPKIWDILKKGVEEVVGKGSALQQFLFQVAYTGRYFAVQQGRESPLFRGVVFKKLSDMLGGKLAVGITGGGPISADVHGFIRTAFCMPLMQGYALTETSCAGSVQMFEDVRFGVVGPPLGSVELRIRSCVNDKGEAEVLDRSGKPYLESDREHYGTPCIGRGEVMIRGPSVSSGYFKQPDKTAEVFDLDGWFHTGDVGLFTPDGALMIVDRVKNLVKLKGGEYIAIEAMEKEYSTSAFVNGVHGGIMCYGDGDMDRPVALVQANTVELEKWAKAQGTTYKSVEELCKLPVAEKAVLDSLNAAGKAGDLAANEILCAIALIPGTGPMEGDATTTSPWTSENGGLTASNKLNRKPIQMTYASLLDPLRKKAAR
mmetsp:Transcript_148056/g.369082  ORF Transcript_148056/g.369082 Transcript_148056/m.369082 type:complete len:770 (-) Transcript_148056:371-2680(-)|eukprot:CAMPEP_0115271916 /NCGR_PEP_ID=MMETSP0270-20121206/54352_1 /TAXON_ID=71861 /ORGANISM="Scrippsiella trochoidea, Strain CCMP3099" /LENGTH=769 /DNA_ID=CAMNT_0002688303 /DNA_START=60 /DNA_END=2369 /DNA_ORIENTATION=+